MPDRPVVEPTEERRPRGADYRVDSQTGCWLWQKQVLHGYGKAYVQGRQVRAHRLYYECERGPIPEGYELHHVCGIKTCVNPAHLEALPKRTHRYLHPRTHCHRGHPLEGENVLLNSRTGERRCRICRWASRERFHAKRRSNDG